MKVEFELNRERLQQAIEAQVREEVMAMYRNAPRRELAQMIANGLVSAISESGELPELDGTHEARVKRSRAIALREFRADIISATAKRASDAGWLRRAAKAAILSVASDELRGHASSLVRSAMERLGYEADAAIGGER